MLCSLQICTHIALINYHVLLDTCVSSIIIPLKWRMWAGDTAHLSQYVASMHEALARPSAWLSQVRWWKSVILVLKVRKQGHQEFKIILSNNPSLWPAWSTGDPMSEKKIKHIPYVHIWHDQSLKHILHKTETENALFWKDLRVVPTWADTLW